MAILLAGFIYLTVVILGSLDTLQATVDGWIETAFNNNDLRPVFNVLEASVCGCLRNFPILRNFPNFTKFSNITKFYNFTKFYGIKESEI